SHGTTSLTVEDALAIARDVPSIKRVTPNVDGRAQVVSGNRNWNTHWRGINQEYFDIRHWPVARGAPFLEDDVTHVRSIVLLDDILCSAVAPEAVNPAIAEITSLLRQRHHIRPGQDDDFNVRRPDEIIKAQIETSHTLEALLISIAAIALVVGGIGVMNVMLVSV